VSQLKERSALLETSGRSAQGETEAVRELLATANRELEAVKRSSSALEARLGPLEQECRDAQAAQEHLRYTHGVGLGVMTRTGEVWAGACRCLCWRFQA